MKWHENHNCQPTISKCCVKQEDNWSSVVSCGHGRHFRPISCYFCENRKKTPKVGVLWLFKKKKNDAVKITKRKKHKDIIGVRTRGVGRGCGLHERELCVCVSERVQWPSAGWCVWDSVGLWSWGLFKLNSVGSSGPGYKNPPIELERMCSAYSSA